MRIERHPHYRDKLVVFDGASAMGDGKVVDATPAMLNAMRKIEMQAATTTARPLQDRATYAAYIAECPERNVRTFNLWCTRHQVPIRESAAIVIEARADGYNLDGAGEHVLELAARTTPAVSPRDAIATELMARYRGESVPTPIAPDPRLRRAVLVEDPDLDDDEIPAVPVTDGDLDEMQMPDTATLAMLKRASIVRRGMSQQQFDARLKRVGLSLSARMQRTWEAANAGWFTGGAVPGTISLPGSAGGSQTTVSQERPAATVSVKPERRSTRIANLSASTLIKLQEIETSLASLKARLRRQTGQRIGDLDARASDGRGLSLSGSVWDWAP